MERAAIFISFFLADGQNLCGVMELTVKVHEDETLHVLFHHEIGLVICDETSLLTPESRCLASPLQEANLPPFLHLALSVRPLHG